MKIDFEMLNRKFRIETISDTQVQLCELKIMQDKKSKNFGKEIETFLGYHADECEALKKLNKVIPLTQPMIDTFEKLCQVRESVFKEVSDIKQRYGLK